MQLPDYISEDFVKDILEKGQEEEFLQSLNDKMESMKNGFKKQQEEVFQEILLEKSGHKQAALALQYVRLEMINRRLP